MSKHRMSYTDLNKKRSATSTVVIAVILVVLLAVLGYMFIAQLDKSLGRHDKGTPGRAVSGQIKADASEQVDADTIVALVETSLRK